MLSLNSIEIIEIEAYAERGANQMGNVEWRERKVNSIAPGETSEALTCQRTYPVVKILKKIL